MLCESLQLVRKAPSFRYLPPMSLVVRLHASNGRQSLSRAWRDLLARTRDFDLTQPLKMYAVGNNSFFAFKKEIKPWAIGLQVSDHWQPNADNGCSVTRLEGGAYIVVQEDMRHSDLDEEIDSLAKRVWCPMGSYLNPRRSVIIEQMHCLSADTDDCCRVKMHLPISPERRIKPRRD